MNASITAVAAKNFETVRNAREYYRGDIVLCALPNFENSSVEGSVRPCIIVSNNRSNHFSPVLSIIPLTSAKKKPLPVHVELNYLPKESIALVEQLTVIDKANVLKVFGRAAEETMRAIDQAMLIQFAI